MVASYLTDEMKKSGAILIEKMDEYGMRPDAAFWLYDSEADAWRLIIAEVKVGEVGPIEEYRKVLELIQQFEKELAGLSLDDVSLTTPDTPLVSALRRIIKTGQNIVGMRFRDNIVHGTKIDDAYIYRIA